MSPLVDAFGREHTYLRISVTDRCNLRCVYCMPAEGVPWRPRDEILTLEEIEGVARVCVGLGVRKIRLTGGEPLVRQNLEWLVERLAALPGLETLALTTNGVLLRERAAALRAAGLHRLNVSLDTLRHDRFSAMAGRDALDDVLSGIEAALAAGFTPLKLNVVVIAGQNDDELLDFVGLARDRPIHVRFIEYMPFPGNGWRSAGFLPYGEMLRAVQARHRLLPAPSEAGVVAKAYRVEGFRGEIGFISPISAEFCGTCTRLRLAADGSLKTCLYAPPAGSLRGLLRAGATDDVLADAIRAALQGKPARHPSTPELAGASERSMVEIGG